MKNMKNTMGKLRNFALGGLTALLIGVMPGRGGAETQQAFNPNRFNPFIQQNDSTLVYYGSGDVNKDNRIDINDVNSARLMLGKTTTNSSKEYDMADVDGDGVITNLDLSKLGDFVDNRTSYLQAHWNKMQTPEERTSWTKKMNTIDKTDEIKYIAGKWECDDYSNQVHINFSGYENNDIPSKYNKQNVGRFNLPLYYVRIWNGNFGHSVNGILVGDNPLNFNDWYFLDDTEFDSYPTIDDEWTFPANSNIDINIIKKFVDNSPVYTNQIRFNIDGNRNVSLDSHNPELVLQRPGQTAVEEVRPAEFSLSQNYPNPFNSSTTIEYNLEKPGKVTLEVFNIAGQRLETLVDENQTAGNHRINWNADKYSSGTYLYRLNTGKTEEVKRMMIVK